MKARRPLCVAAAALSLTLSACAMGPWGAGGSDSGSTSQQTQITDSQEPSASEQETSSAAQTSVSAAEANACLDTARSMSLEQQVQQLYMGSITATDGTSAATQLANQNVGSVILMANPGSAQQASAVTSSLTAQNSQVLIAADQEGGEVVRLSGPGFTDIPAATTQNTQTTEQITQDWTTWAGELKEAGVPYDLAPVADLVPNDNMALNQPIGQLNRGYGHSRDDIVANTTAVIDGMHSAGVVTSAKHFPGLGYVTTNTDLGVAHDTVTTADSEGVQIFSDLADSSDSIMVSSAIYDQMDAANPAVFSSEIITDLLRGQIGYDKAVISDDLGSAGSLAAYPVASRGTMFLQAGGDLALNVDPSSVNQMVADTVQAAQNDQEFATALPDKVARVLILKQSAGINACSA